MGGYRRATELKRCKERKDRSKKETDSTLQRNEMRKGILSNKRNKNDESNTSMYVTATHS